MAARFLSLFAILACVSFSLQASIKKPPKLRITQTAIYAGTKYGLAISTNDGISWSKPADFKNISVANINSDGNGGIYVGAATGFFKSTDDSHWSDVTAPTVVKNVQSSYLAPNGQEIYIGSGYNSGNLRYTQTGGQPWGVKPVGKKTSVIFGLGALGDTVYALTQDAGLYQSVNKGDTWRLLAYPTAYSVSIAYSFFAYNGRLYVGTDSGLLISEDQGKTWNKYLSSSTIFTIYVTKVNDNKDETIFAGGYDGLAVSQDFGKTWKNNDNVPPIMSLYVSDDATMYVGTSGSGLMVSSDGLVWDTITTDDGLPDNGILAVYAEDRDIGGN